VNSVPEKRKKNLKFREIAHSFFLFSFFLQLEKNTWYTCHDIMLSLIILT